MAYDKRMEVLPLFISFPRTGAHWLNCFMELYFDKPRLREGRVTFLDRGRTDWMWFHDHDFDLELHHGDVLYLYREPVATIFSNLVYEYTSSKNPLLRLQLARKKNVFGEKEVTIFSNRYRQHLVKWMVSSKRARTIICYDKFKKQMNIEFKAICQHFRVKFDPERISWASTIVTKDALVRKVGNMAEMGRHMLQSSYEMKRMTFSERWGDIIKEIVIVPELENYF